MEAWGVNVAICGFQKGFMMPTGLAIVGVSEKGAGSPQDGHFCRAAFDYDDIIRANKDGYFPYTPAATLLRGLRASIDMLEAEGLDAIAAPPPVGHRRAQGRGSVGLSPLRQTPKWYSDTVSAVMVPDGCDANEVIRKAYHTYNLSLGAGLSKVAGKVFRIGHLGYVNEIMVLASIGGVEMALLDCGLPIKAGSGVGAAVRSTIAAPPSAGI